MDLINNSIFLIIKLFKLFKITSSALIYIYIYIYIYRLGSRYFFIYFLIYDRNSNLNSHIRISEDPED